MGSVIMKLQELTTFCTVAVALFSGTALGWSAYRRQPYQYTPPNWAWHDINININPDAWQQGGRVTDLFPGGSPTRLPIAPGGQRPFFYARDDNVNGWDNYAPHWGSRFLYMSPDEWHQGAQLAERAIDLFPGGPPRSLVPPEGQGGNQNEGNR